MGQKYVVLKLEDCNKYLDDLGQMALDLICQTIVDGRYEDGKKFNEYIVINKDENYINDIINVLKNNGHWD